MPIVPLPIANGFYLSDSLPISAQQCTNWYPNIVQTQGLQQETLFGTDGATQATTTGEVNQVNRGGTTKAGILYEVNGNALYQIDQVFDVDGNESFTSINLGAIEGVGRVFMADNGTQLMILVPFGKGYIYDATAGTPFQEITDVDFIANGNPIGLVFIDTYFVCTTDGNKFIISAVNNGLAWNALDFGTAESDPDFVSVPFVDNNQLFIAGTDTLEAFSNVPSGADFPFQRNGLFIDKGVDAPFGAVSTDEGFAFIGSGENESPAIWEVIRNGRRKISTTAIDSILQGFTEEEIQQSFAWSYAVKGAYFVGFTLPTTTLVLDTVTGRWHERKSQVVNEFGNVETRRWRANSVTKAYGRIFIGDSVDGRIGILSPDVYTEYGNDIIRTISTQPFFNNNKSISVPSIELIFESGVGNKEVPDPKIRLSISKDAKTYGPERIRAMGKIGEYERRGIWHRNGRAGRFDIFKFVLSDAVKPVIIGLTANIVGGSK